jgi:hypothetical protein
LTDAGQIKDIIIIVRLMRRVDSFSGRVERMGNQEHREADIVGLKEECM